MGFFFIRPNLELGLRRGLLQRAVLLCLIAGLPVIPAQAVTRTTHPHHSRKASAHPANRFRLLKWNPIFAGSHDLLVHQNIELDKLQLPRINDDVELMRYELSQDLVPVSESDALKIAPNLQDNRRYCRPWTRDFLQDFSEAFYSEFHDPVQVNSLVRTAEQQRQLRRHNRFAAPEAGETASTHLTGVTVDLSRRGLSKSEYQWMLNYLMPLHEAGLVEPIEERQPVLHIVVYEKYSDRLGVDRSWSEANEPTEMTLSSAPPSNQP